MTLLIPDIDPLVLKNSGTEEGYWATYIGCKVFDDIRVIASVNDGKVTEMSLHGPWTGCFWVRNNHCMV